MSQYTLKDYEIKKDMPGYSGGPAKVLNLTLEDEKGETAQAEMFTMASTVLPNIGDKLEGTIEQSDYGPKWKKAGGRQGGGRGGYRQKIEPAEAKGVHRQHSQEMMLMLMGNLGARWTGDQMRSVINWFEQDIVTKDRATVWDGFTDDVPGDLSDTPFSDE